MNIILLFSPRRHASPASRWQRRPLASDYYCYTPWATLLSKPKQCTEALML